MAASSAGVGRSYRRPEPLDQDAFDAAARSLVEDAEDYSDKNWKPARIEGWEQFHGKVDLKTEDGDDTSVAYEVRDTVNQVLPEVIEQLAGDDEPVEYYTRDPRKQGLTRQATMLAQALFWEGGGWVAVHDGTMHAAVGRIGVMKVCKEEKLKFEEVEFQGEHPDYIESIGNGDVPGVVLMDREDVYEDELGNPTEYAMAANGTARRYFVEERHVITAPDPATVFCSYAPEEDEALCVGQHTVVRMGQLREMGFSLDELEGVSGHEADEQATERETRSGESQQTKQNHGTWALSPVSLREAYIRLDADGDGFLERWKVIMAGTEKKVLRRERIHDQPYVFFTMRRSPHTIQGLSIPDLVHDIQRMRTKLLRGLMENTDLINSPMLFGSGTLNWSQLQRIKKYKVVNEVTPGAVRWFTPAPVAGEVLPVLDYLRQMRSERVGADPQAMGLQPDQLTGVAAVAVAGAQAASGRIIKFAVRTVAETGLRKVYSKLLRLMVGMPPQFVERQDGRYVETNPRLFDPAWGVRPRVGLGALARQERLGAYRELIALAQGIVGQMGPRNPFTDPEKLAGLIQGAVAEFKGLGAQRFFNNPDEARAFMDEQAQQPPPPDPKMEEVRRKQAADQQNAQLKMTEIGARQQLDAMLGQHRTEATTQVMRERNLLQHDERVMEMGMQIPLEKMAIEARARSGQGNLPRRAR